MQFKYKVVFVGLVAVALVIMPSQMSAQTDELDTQTPAISNIEPEEESVTELVGEEEGPQVVEEPSFSAILEKLESLLENSGSKDSLLSLQEELVSLAEIEGKAQLLQEEKPFFWKQRLRFSSAILKIKSVTLSRQVEILAQEGVIKEDLAQDIKVLLEGLNK